MADAFRIAEDVIRNQDRYPEEFIVLRFETLQSLFSPQRARLIRYLKKYGPAVSVGALAHALHRKVPAVSRDIRELKEWRLIELRPRGRQKEIAAREMPILLR